MLTRTKAHRLLVGLISLALWSSSAFVADPRGGFAKRWDSNQRLSVECGVSASDLVTNTSPPSDQVRAAETTSRDSSPSAETATLCIIGGGVSGLVAAITAAKNVEGDDKIVLLEASDRVGGRVQSDRTQDGFLLDRGFAVFIEEYPMAKKLLDYDKLKLKRFLPGALVKIRDNKGKGKLVKVSDPLRRPRDLFSALVSPVGSIKDKTKLVPLIVNVRRKSISALFEEPETTTAEALQERWGFSSKMMDRFFRPFFEGIFLTPLEQQSSRMFSFVFKMLSEGSATLPENGMGAVAQQLEENALSLGLSIRTNNAVTKLSHNESGGFVMETAQSTVEAENVIVATDVGIAQRLLSQLEGFEFLSEEATPVTQRSVGCLYYAFEGEAPVSDPLLILNGEGQDRDSYASPINNVCFPSVVSADYAPEGFGLCSVAILKGAMDAYQGKEEELDIAVRSQLADWFPDYSKDIGEKWELKRIYYIPNAQPLQLGTASPATVNGGRDSSTILGRELPSGLFLCGDYMATASLNGALESGVNAGMAAAATKIVTR
ncbi:Amine oxidase family protein [Seminavis robusta]|uniref:Amine oxidase family protein n=1 Tax=Seminavis robusta TaxID=568900 RepID=A0A9N8EHN6_9STRA|nr:Amine oxidase family protein [Seminavis robusta]|eukprot:Sro1228_g254410.1 Amine oxidase family protein (547) ;mRNA; r:12672-14312